MQTNLTEEDEILTPIETPEDLPLSGDIWDVDEPFVEDANSEEYDMFSNQDGCWNHEPVSSGQQAMMTTPVRSADEQLQMAIANQQIEASIQTDFMRADQSTKSDFLNINYVQSLQPASPAEVTDEEIYE